MGPGVRRDDVRCAALNRRPLQRDFDDAPQGFDLEGFLQRRAVAVFFRKPGRAITGGKDKGDVARVYQFGDRRYHLAIYVDVENGKVISPVAELIDSRNIPFVFRSEEHTSKLQSP